MGPLGATVGEAFGSLGSTAHVIQVALAPAFLLSALATLLNVFSTRLGRVADQADALAAEVERVDARADARADALERRVLLLRLDRLRRRSVALDVAVVLASLGGALVGTSILTLFVGALRDAGTASVLFLTFGAAILCTVAALGAFLAETLMAGRGMRHVVAAKQEEVREDATRR